MASPVTLEKQKFFEDIQMVFLQFFFASLALSNLKKFPGVMCPCIPKVHGQVCVINSVLNQGLIEELPDTLL